MSTPAPTELPAVAGGRPPVEYRVLGLDKRTFALPLLVVAVFLLWAVVSPAVNNAVDYDDPVRAGDALIIGPATTMAPPAGWGVLEGLRTTDAVRAPVPENARATVTGDGITLSTEAGPFTGDARALVKQVSENDEKIAGDSNFTIKGRPHTITIDGHRGVAQEFKTLTGEGAVFGFVQDGKGISIIVTGTEDALDRATTKLGHTLASIDFDAQGLS